MISCVHYKRFMAFLCVIDQIFQKGTALAVDQTTDSSFDVRVREGGLYLSVQQLIHFLDVRGLYFTCLSNDCFNFSVLGLGRPDFTCLSSN